MENVILNQNIYKFSQTIIDMTTINSKDISKLSIKELEDCIWELDLWLGIKKGEADIKAGRVIPAEEVFDRLLKKCQKE